MIAIKDLSLVLVVPRILPLLKTVVCWFVYRESLIHCRMQGSDTHSGFRGCHVLGLLKQSLTAWVGRGLCKWNVLSYRCGGCKTTINVSGGCSEGSGAVLSP